MKLNGYETNQKEKGKKKKVVLNLLKKQKQYRDKWKMKNKIGKTNCRRMVFIVNTKPYYYIKSI